MADSPVWFTRIRRYFVLDCSACTASVEQLAEPRARVTTVGEDGLSERCLQELPEHLTILSNDPTEEKEVIVEYDDASFEEVDVDGKHALYDHQERLD